MGLKIAILGTRGIPNNYGGFEHIAGHLSRGFVQKGHEVTVYNSHKHPYRNNKWHGVRIIHCFDPEYLIGEAGQFVYDLNCIIDVHKHNYDIILMLGYTSSSVWKFLYPSKAVIITNMDGLEWKRAKYSEPVRRFLKYAEKLAVRSCKFHIADSPIIKNYLDKKYNIRCKYIAYGSEPYPFSDERILEEYGLKKHRYFLLMARMERENNIEMILDGYCLTGSTLKFIVIGNTSNKYGRYLADKYKTEKRIVFTGAIFDEFRVRSLTANCVLYFHGHSVGGTNPSLLDAMAVRAPVAAHFNPFNHSVLKENALFFSDEYDVRRIINGRQYSNGEHVRNNHTAIVNEFSWERIIDQYEDYIIECYRSGHEYYPFKKEKSILYSIK
jgi:glycosyltransferase involved in cell wall biosynthesis